MSSGSDVIFPDGAERWNRSMRGAYRKGYEAAIRGDDRSSPYVDIRKNDGRLTWSRAYDKAWIDGYDAGAKRPAAG